MMTPTVRWRFSPAARATLSASREEALALGFAWIHPEHMALAVLHAAATDPGTAAALRACDCDGAALRAAIIAALPSGSHTAERGPDLAFTRRAVEVLDLSQELADAMPVEAVAPAHLLLGIVVQGKGLAARLLREAGVTEARLRSALAAERHSGPPPT